MSSSAGNRGMAISSSRKATGCRNSCGTDILASIFRHQPLPAGRLITTLANAVDTVRDQHRDIVLPELSAALIVSAPPIKPLTRGPPPPYRRSRGG